MRPPPGSIKLERLLAELRLQPGASHGPWIPDVAGLLPLEVGRAVAEATAVLSSSDSPGLARLRAHALLMATREHVPAWDEWSALAFIEVLPGASPVDDYRVGLFLNAIRALEDPPRVADAAARLAERVLAEEVVPHGVESLIALSTVTDPAAASRLQAEVASRLEGAGLALVEAQALLRGGLPTARAAVDFERSLPSDVSRDMARQAARQLAASDAYLASAREVSDLLLRRLADLETGVVEYRSDRLVLPADVAAIGRAFAAGAVLNRGWYRASIRRVLRGTSIAPNGSRTAPSQALAHRLARVVAAIPTPESVDGLAETTGLTLHAGLRKRLERRLKAARSRMPASARIGASTVPRTAVARRRGIATFLTALQADYVWQRSIPREVWESDFLADEVVGDAARAIIWTITSRGSRTSVMASDSRLVGPDGRPVRPDAVGRVELWHPASALPDERSAWQAGITAKHVRQPFRQAFREWFAVAETATPGPVRLFDGLVGHARPVLGVAAREGWQSDRSDELLRRVFADRWMVELRTNPGLYPGADGLFEFGEVKVRIAEGGWRPGSWQELPPVVASEILRSADLLASVGTFAVIDGPETGERLRLLSRLDQLPLHGQAQARRAALARVFADHPRGDHLSLDDRHARIRTKLGTYAVHLSTGLVTGPDGAVSPPSAEIASGLTPVPWLPYDEPLFERIAAAIAELLDRP